jgi:DNA (cytosine-5)-methyltransferase 1
MLSEINEFVAENAWSKTARKLKLPEKNVEMLYVDLFCGAGGVTSGVVRARINGDRCAKVLYCVNHDYNAIQSHKANHKRTKHAVEDIRTMDLADLIKTVKRWRALYPNAKLSLWASLECTNFSKAKGGLPRDADSRTLAYSLFRYIEAINPDYIQIENVTEFMAWGPMRIRAKKTYDKAKYPYTELSWMQDKKSGEWSYGWTPIDKLKGAEYVEWKEKVQAYGYEFQHKVINCADLGAYTSRKRYFGIFAKPDLPIVFPEQTHWKVPAPGRRKWKAVKRVLELHDHGESIFTRDPMLVPKTLERIYAGLVKYIAGMGIQQFMQQTYACSSNGMNNFPITNPSRSVTTRDATNLVTTTFLTKRFSGRPWGKVIPTDGPAGTVTTIPGQDLITVETPDPFFQLHYTNGGNIASVNEPSPAVPTKDRISKVQPVPVAFIQNYFSNGGEHSSIDDPIGAQLGRPKSSVVTTEWIDEGYGNAASHKSINVPAGAITGNAAKMNVVHAEQMLLDMSYDHAAKPLTDPCPTVTADRRWFHLLNPQYLNTLSEIDNPCFTLIARMDKAAPHLVVTEEGELAIKILSTDSEVMVKIKEFMAMYGLADIKMRMLKIRELKLITGFSANYILKGNQSEQKKFIGNAVPVVVSKTWTEALSMKLREYRELALAA